MTARSCPHHVAGIPAKTICPRSQAVRPARTFRLSGSESAAVCGDGGRTRDDQYLPGALRRGDAWGHDLQPSHRDDLAHLTTLGERGVDLLDEQKADSVLSARRQAERGNAGSVGTDMVQPSVVLYVLTQPPIGGAADWRA